jgi:bifunctional non-homologous end joining protein LigD
MSRIASSRQRSSSRFLARVLPGAKPAPFPGFIEPALANLGTKVPSGAGYVHEVKLDGYRVQAHLNDGQVTLYTRSGLDWTKRFPTIAADIARLPARKLVIDGEVVSADANGRPNFGALQDDLKQRRYDRMVYYAFDLLHLDGFDTRAAPLIERKRMLQGFLAEAAVSGIIFSEQFDDGADLYKRARRMGLEGIVSKRADAPYRSGRTEAWIKVKCWNRDRFVVVGFVPDGAGGLAKLRLARREGRTLVYVGRVGTGWDYKTARAVRAALAPHARPTSPLSKPIRKRDTTWVEPHFDAEVAYADITDDGMLRHPSFKGLVHQDGAAAKK